MKGQYRNTCKDMSKAIRAHVWPVSDLSPSGRLAPGETTGCFQLDLTIIRSDTIFVIVLDSLLV